MSTSVVFYSAILTTTGVFMMGDVFGSVTPELVALSDVADISMKYDHILALTTSGKLFAWGSNNSGECGVDSRAVQIYKPTRVRGFEDYHIRQVSAGAGYSLLRCAPK